MGRDLFGQQRKCGKRRSGRIPNGDRWLRHTLVLAAQAASHAKDSVLASRLRRLAARRGNKRACIALGHSILKIAYHVLKDGCVYQDLGGNYFDRLEPKRLVRYLTGVWKASVIMLPLSPRGPVDPQRLTQVGGALKELSIQTIPAHSP